jgi:hypothetical protein
MRAYAVLLVICSAVAFAPVAKSQDRTFGGYDCTDECQGHSAGYKWAERKGITDEANCPFGNSRSFHEGCIAYTEDPTRDPDEDDDGNPIDSR